MKKELVAMIVAGTMIVTMGPIAIASQRPEDDLTMMLPENQYELRESVEVNGRQGVCSEGNYYWVSGSTTLAKYDKDWKLIKLTDDPFAGYELEVNHIADMVTEVYSHILDEGRRNNARLFEDAFYSGRDKDSDGSRRKEKEDRDTAPDSALEQTTMDADTARAAENIGTQTESDMETLMRLLKNPEIAGMLKTLSQAI